jgi:peptidoglycan/LPS O-acetylase OafA/YrhL
MDRLLVRIRLFISSYVPLFVILAIRFRDLELEVACILAAALGATSLVLLLWKARRIQPDPHRIETVADRGAEVAGYLATYLLPFVTVTEPSARDIAAYVAFLAVVGIVYVQSDMVQINPLLYLFGYRVSAVTTGDGWSGVLISRSQPRRGSAVLASRLQDTVALERTRDPHGHPVATGHPERSRR